MDKQKRKNGEGSFKELENHRIQMRKQVGVLENGRPRILTVTGSSQTECIKLMKKREEKIAQRKFDSSKYRKISLSELCYRHFEADKSKPDLLRPKSLDRRECTIRNQIEKHNIGKKCASIITPKNIEDHIGMLINETSLSVSSVEKTLNVINAAYKWAINQGYTSYNPCSPMMDNLKARLENKNKKDNINGVIRILGEEEVKTLKNAVYRLKEGKLNRYLFGLGILILLETGIRVGELCALRWEDWDPKCKTLSITKTRFIAKNKLVIEEGYTPGENGVKNKKGRVIVLNDRANELFREIYQITPCNTEKDYVILNNRNKPTNPSNFDDRLNKIYRCAGLPADISGAHILRRTHATALHDEGCRIEDIAVYLGDIPETIQEHYISTTKRIIADGKVKNVVAIPKKMVLA